MAKRLFTCNAGHVCTSTTCRALSEALQLPKQGRPGQHVHRPCYHTTRGGQPALGGSSNSNISESLARKRCSLLQDYTFSVPDAEGGGGGGTMPVLVYHTMPPMAQATPTNFLSVMESPKKRIPLVTMNTVLRCPTTL